MIAALEREGSGVLRRLGGALCAGILAVSCASLDPLQSQVESLLISHQTTQALQRIEGAREKGYGRRNRLLYELDRGLVLTLAERWAEATGAFENAKNILDELYTASLTAEAGSFMINDLTLPYAGEDFEAAQVHYFEAKCYAGQGKFEEALVEARQTDLLLNRLNDRYDEHKNVYREDAFLRYFSALLWEAAGHPNDALIADEKAWEAYTGSYAEAGYATPPPEGLRADLLRLSAALGIRADAWRGTLGESDSQPIPHGWGEVVLFHESGFAPRKVENRITVPMPDGYLLPVALPRFERRPPALTRVELRAGEEGPSARGEFVQDLEGIAVKNLEDRMLRVTAKAIARATAKYLAAKAAQKETKKQTGDDEKAKNVFRLMNALHAAMERADTRSWRLLPARIHVARLRLPAGTHDLLARASGAGGVGEDHAFPSVSVPAGGKVFLFWRTFR